jgi:hypothetical protein
MGTAFAAAVAAKGGALFLSAESFFARGHPTSVVGPLSSDVVLFVWLRESRLGPLQQADRADDTTDTYSGAEAKARDRAAA